MSEDVLSEALKDSGVSLDVKDNNLKVITTLAMRQLEMEAAVEAAEVRLQELKAELKNVAEVQLPTAMLEAGMRTFTLNNGAAVKVSKFYGASIKVENRSEAFRWLVEQGHEGIIKTNVVTEFGKGVEERRNAMKFAWELQSDGYAAVLDESVHAQTLKAFVREQTEQNERLPKEERVEFPPCFTIFIGDQAKIILPKGKK